MRLAQRLYEGVDFGEGPVGLITYMRTDSVSLGARRDQEIRSVIGKLYGKAALPDTPRVYKTKSKNAQEAHEGVRPTSAARTPEQLAGKIEADEHKLYMLIWRRAVASQMEAAVFDTVAVDLAAGPGNLFRANGSTLLSPGFLAVYRESFDDVSLNPDDDENRLLPALEKGDEVRLLAIDTEQHFTEPPPRYSEASLVKALEEHGIGRPSTYASIIQTLLYKKYCELVNKRFIPTDLGKIVSRFLTGNFERYVDYGFTAAMEDELDNISRGEEDWLPMLERFWDDLKKQVDDVTENVTRSDVAMERPLGIDPVSGRPVSVRYGRFGAFAQIGTREDEEKPRFASLKPGQRMDDLTLDLALELFQLPRTLGPGRTATRSRWRWAASAPTCSTARRNTRRSRRKTTRTRSRSSARRRSSAKSRRSRRTGSSRSSATPASRCSNGRYGPYITDGKKNGKIPKDRDPNSLTLEECQALLAVAPERGANRWGRKTTAKTTGKTAAKVERRR